MSWWLTTSMRDGDDDPFGIWDVMECPDSESVRGEIAGDLLRSGLLGEELISFVSQIACGSAMRTLLDTRLAADPKIQRGCFGEVVTGAILENLHGRIVPIKKLRYRTASYDVPKATDVFSILVANGELVEIGYNEVKLRTTRSDLSTLASKAHNQVRKDVSFPNPEVVGFVIARLLDSREGGNDTLAGVLVSYLENRRILNIDAHRIFLILDAEIWRDQDLDSLRETDELLAPLDIHIVSIANLSNLVTSTYRSVRMEAIPEDD